MYWMLKSLSPERLSDLLIAPCENLEVEIKNWLDLKNDKNAKATFAKAALALANHGGGFIILGLTESDAGFVEAEGRPATLNAYNQDLINGIIQHYADPAFHCAVHYEAARDGKLFPVVVIPGNHRSPIRARSGGPNGNTVENNAIYIRKPGPRSETPTSAQEWDALLARCLSNRRDEMLDLIRDLMSGAVTKTAEPGNSSGLVSWIDQSLLRWQALTEDLPADAPERCPHGYYCIAYELSGNFREISSSQIPELLQRSVLHHTGWPVFWYPTRQDIQPYAIDGLVECWLGGGTQTSMLGDHDAAHSDFWRISPDGRAFLLRGYQEDSIAHKTPASLFDVTVPVWRVGEALLHSERLASNLIDGPATVTFAVHYSGLSGRSLTSVNGSRIISSGRVSRQNQIALQTNVDTASITPNLPEIVHPLLSPLYSLFNFFDLPMALVTEELAKLRRGNF
jgi:hypothetical protein